MKPSRSTRRHPDSPRVQELLDTMRSSPIQSREGLLLFACLLMLRLLEQRDRELQAVAEFEGRRRNSIFPDSGPWKYLAEHPHPSVSRLIADLARQRSSAEPTVHFLAEALTKLFLPPKYADDVDPKRQLLPQFIRIIEQFDFSDPASLNSASDIFEDLLDRSTRSEKHSGQFTTPPDLCRFMVDIAAPKAGERIYDPCFGMGGLLVTAARRLQDSHSALAPGGWEELQENSIFGIEQQFDLCLLATVRLMLAGIHTPRLECGDTLERDPGQRRGSQGFDCIIAQPPFGQKLERGVSNLYRIPSSSGENLFLQHILGSLKVGGRAVVLVSEGLLFRGGAEEQLRKLMLNEYRVDAVVSLPPGAMMPYAAVKTSLLVVHRQPPRPNVWFVQDSFVSKLVTNAQIPSPGYTMLVSALQASQQEGTADPKLRREIEQIATSQAAVFHQERSELERSRAALAQQQAALRSKLGELEKQESNLQNMQTLASTLREVRPTIEQTIPDNQQELARSRSELQAIQTEKPVTDHGKRILESRIRKLTSTIRDCESGIAESQKQLATIDSRIRDSEEAARNIEPRIAAAQAETRLTRQKIDELSRRTGEVERRLSDIHASAKDWEIVQELSDISQFFLSKYPDPQDAGELRPITGDHLPKSVVPISRLAGKGWELVFKEAAPETLGEFLKSFTQAIPQSRVVTLGEIADISRGLQYGRDRDKPLNRKSPEIRQLIKTLRVQDLPKDDEAEPEGVPVVDPSAPKIIDGAVRPPRETDMLRTGDVVLSIGGTVGRVSIVGDFAGKAVASNGLAVIRCHDTTTSQYVAAILRTEPYQSWLTENSSGTSIRHLSVRLMREMRIPLPPLEIQQKLSSAIRPGQSVEAVLSLLSTRRSATRFVDSVFQDALLKKWAALSSEDVQFGSGLTHLLTRTLASSRSWSELLRRESPDDPTAVTLQAWIETLKEFEETRELRGETDRWAAMQSWFTHFNDERGQFANAFRRLREIRNRAAHGIEPAEDPGVLWKYSLLEKLRDSLRLIWEHETKSLTETTQVVGSLSPSILTVGVESELTFTVRNEGALPLRRIEFTTVPFESSTSCSSLSPKEEHRWTLKLRPHEPGKLNLTIKWTAHRLDREAVSGEILLAIEIKSLRDQAVSKRLDTIPYITGISLEASDASLFFGRDDIFKEIKRCLRTTGPSTVIILEGVRRVGKTSLLKQLMRPGFLPDWIPVYYDFQGADNSTREHGVPTGTIFYEVAKEIALACHRADISFDVPQVGHVSPSRRAHEIATAFREKLRPSFEETSSPFEQFKLIVQGILPEIGDKRLLLLLDEFDKVQAGIENHITSPQVPDNFRNLFHSNRQISAILTGSQLMKRLRREYFNPLFGIGHPIPIGPLDRKSAQELVTKPVEGYFVFADAARDWIVDACACQPFLIQHLCSRVVDLCSEGQQSISTDHVRTAAEVWLKRDTHFETVWRDDITEPRRQYVTCAIQELAAGPDPVTFDLIRQVLEKRGLYGSTALGDYLNDLRDLAVIIKDEKERIHTYRIAIPLFAEWLRVKIDPTQYLTKAVQVDGGKL